MDKLQTIYVDSTPDPEAKWHVGQSVIAKYAQDQLYYRGRITNITDAGITVRLVDDSDHKSSAMVELDDYTLIKV